MRLLGVLVSLALAAPVWAAEDGVLPKPPEGVKPYSHRAQDKLETGLLYVGVSPLHLLEDPLQGTVDGPPVIGTIGGIGMGLMCSSVMALSGLVNVATAWWPAWWIDARRYYPSCVLGIDEGDFSTILGR